MVSGFICGASNLREEDDYERLTRSAGSSPRKSRSSKTNKNPYSTRGLDKFSALLVDLEEKKQQIYSDLSPDEISLVRFVYSGDHDVKPIVVKSKPKAAEPKKRKLIKLPSSPSMVVLKEENKSENICKKKMALCNKVRGFQWSQPKLYLPIIVILILIILVLFGRSFAIMCTSIVWYVLPTIANNDNGHNSSNTRRSFKKKDYVTVRRLSEKNMITSERTTVIKSSEAKSQQQNGHRRCV